MREADLLKLQSEAVGLACACLAAAYHVPVDCQPRLWLDVAAAEFLRFAQDRRASRTPTGGLGEAGLGGWGGWGVAWMAMHDGTTPFGLIALSIAGNRTARAFLRARQVIDEVLAASDQPAESPAAYTTPLEYRGKTVAHLVGGLLNRDGSPSLAPAADHDPALAPLFTALARAASDRVIQTLGRRAELAGHLTPGQARVLSLIGESLTRPEIIQRTEMSAHTLHDHITQIYKSFGVRTCPPGS